MTTTLSIPTYAHHWTVTTKDELGRTLVETDLFGANRKYTYSGLSYLPTTETDPCGNSWAYTYDSLGNVITASLNGEVINVLGENSLVSTPTVKVKSPTTILRWRYMVPYVAFLVAIALDIISTYIVMKHFGGVETDPAALWAFSRIGTKAMFIPVALGTFGGLGLIKYARIRSARWLEVLVVIMFCVAAFAHARAGVDNMVIALHSTQPTQVVTATINPSGPLAATSGQ